MTANKAEVREKVRKIVAERFGVDEKELKDNASFIDDLGADSLDTVELVITLEEEFNQEIPDEDAEKINTVQDAIDYVSGHIEAEAK
jgi:acyl carrier protein